MPQELLEDKPYRGVYKRQEGVGSAPSRDEWRYTIDMYGTGGGPLDDMDQYRDAQGKLPWEDQGWRAPMPWLSPHDEMFGMPYRQGNVLATWRHQLTSVR